jgi:hypothetical protein
LTDYINFEWGGHTFSYLIEGEQGLFWCGRIWDGADNDRIVVGQYPKPGSLLQVATTEISFQNATMEYAHFPQMLRTPDGYIHVFGGFYDTGNNPWGRLKYYRSASPEDITTLVDRSELIPTSPYSSFHLRQNVGISRDGTRMVWVTETGTRDGSDPVPFNTPVIFVGERQGLDFVFDPPVAYAEPQSLFYPLVAVTDEGIVITGQNQDDTFTTNRIFSRLIHLDWNLNEVNRETFPMNVQGGNKITDMRPLESQDWGKLLLCSQEVPNDFSYGIHRFHQYDLAQKQLTLVGEYDKGYPNSNAGRWIRFHATKSVFVNNPGSSRLVQWLGDMAAGGDLTSKDLVGADPIAQGYQAVHYVSVPSPMYGSVTEPGTFYVAVDVYNPDRVEPNPGPVSFLLYRLSTGYSSSMENWNLYE